MVVEMELTLIKERQRAGREAAKAKGIYKGRRSRSTATLSSGAERWEAAQLH
jgi:DNA invertase Pin-like site-specific DNA recombinase